MLQYSTTATRKSEYYLQEKRYKKEQLDKDQQKQILEFETKEIDWKLHNVEKIIKLLEGIFFFFFFFFEKGFFFLLPVANALKKKSEETKQDMDKLEETLISLKEKRKSIWFMYRHCYSFL